VEGVPGGRGAVITREDQPHSLSQGIPSSPAAACSTICRRR
jgi:hypothetical protein